MPPHRFKCLHLPNELWRIISHLLLASSDSCKINLLDPSLFIPLNKFFHSFQSKRKNTVSAFCSLWALPRSSPFIIIFSALLCVRGTFVIVHFTASRRHKGFTQIKSLPPYRHTLRYAAHISSLFLSSWFHMTYFHKIFLFHNYSYFYDSID